MAFSCFSKFNLRRKFLTYALILLNAVWLRFLKFFAVIVYILAMKVASTCRYFSLREL